jgi:hypothetical protein
MSRKKNAPYRSSNDFIEEIKSTELFESGQWFHPEWLTEVLLKRKFRTTKSRIAEACSYMFMAEILELVMEEIGPQARRCMYRKRLTGRKYLVQKWRKHTNEDMGVSQCCLFPA